MAVVVAVVVVVVVVMIIKIKIKTILQIIIKMVIIEMEERTEMIRTDRIIKAVIFNWMKKRKKGQNRQNTPKP